MTRSKIRTLALIPLLVIVLAMIAAGCGGDDQGPSSDSGQQDPATTSTSDSAPQEDEQESSQQSGDGMVAISAPSDGSLVFDQGSLTAEGGKLEISFDNPSDVIHDVVIEQDGSDVVALERVTNDSTSKSARLAAGDYLFYCSITGHRGAGMEGSLTVE